MDGYQFIAAIFQSLVSLAWPAALVACVWLFREKLGILFPLLQIKYKNFDVSFRLDQAEKEAALIAPPPLSQDPLLTPSYLLLCASSPYAKRGALYEAYKAHYGKDHDPVLVVQAATATINPIVDVKIIADAYSADPASAAAEYGAQFRNDIESYVSIEAVNACVTDSLNVPTILNSVITASSIRQAAVQTA